VKNFNCAELISKLIHTELKELSDILFTGSYLSSECLQHFPLWPELWILIDRNPQDMILDHLLAK
jgi:hypothetical protein